MNNQQTVEDYFKKQKEKTLTVEDYFKKKDKPKTKEILGKQIRRMVPPREKLLYTLSGKPPEPLPPDYFEKAFTKEYWQEVAYKLPQEALQFLGGILGAIGLPTEAKRERETRLRKLGKKPSVGEIIKTGAEPIIGLTTFFPKTAYGFAKDPVGYFHDHPLDVIMLATAFTGRPVYKTVKKVKAGRSILGAEIKDIFRRPKEKIPPELAEAIDKIPADAVIRLEVAGAQPQLPENQPWFSRAGHKIKEMKEHVFPESIAKHDFETAARMRREQIQTGIFESEANMLDIVKNLSKAEKEALPYIREGMKYPEYLETIGRKDLIKHVKNPSPRLQESIAKVGEIYDSAWKLMEANKDVFDLKHYVEGYVSHIWNIPKGVGKNKIINYFRVNDPFLKRRILPTLEEGIKLGMKPKTTNIVDILRKYHKYMHEVLANREFVDLLRGGIDDAGRPLLVIRAELKGLDPKLDLTDYTEMTHGIFGKDKIAYVHPDIASDVNYIIATEKVGKGIPSKLGNAYDSVNSVMKHSQLAISMFHPMALTESAVGFVNPFMATGAHFRAMWRAIRKKNSIIYDPKKFPLAKKGMQRGVNFNPSPDYMINSIEKILRGIEAKGGVAKVGVGVPKYIYETFNRYLWDNLYNMYKLWAFEKLSTRAVKMLRKDTIKRFGREPFPGEIVSIEREAANMTNDCFGGQHWDFFKVLRNKDMQKWAQRVMLAPDWALSVGRQAGIVPRGAYKKLMGEKMIHGGKTLEGFRMAESGKFLGKAGLHYWSRVIIYNTMLLQALNLATTKLIKGKSNFTWENEPNDKFPYNMVRVFIGKGKVGKNIEGGENIYARAGKQYTEVIRYFTEPVKTFGAKSAPLMRMAYKQATGKEVLSDWNTEIAHDKSFWTRMRVMAGDFMPFSLKAVYSGRGRPPLMTAWPVSAGSSQYKVEKDFKRAYKKYGWREDEPIEKADKRAEKLAVEIENITKEAENNGIDWIPLLKTANRDFFNQTDRGNWRQMKIARKQLLEMPTVEEKIQHIDTMRADGDLEEGQAQALVNEIEQKQIAQPLYQQIKQEQKYFEKLLTENRQRADFTYRRMRRAYARVRKEAGILLRDKKRDAALARLRAWNDQFMPDYLLKMAEAAGKSSSEIRSQRLYRNYIFTASKIEALWKGALLKEIYPTLIEREEK